MPRTRKRPTAQATDDTDIARRTRQQHSPQPPLVEEIIEHDDICHICHLLLVRPILTSCAHTFCEACFSHWADVSINQMTMGLNINEPIIVPLADETEARCPMCRTSTTAKIDQPRIVMLQEKYPVTYAVRLEESRQTFGDDDATFIEQLTLYIGNEHKLIRQESMEKSNNHEWRFFVQASRTDIIEEIQVFLHPTFRQPKVVLQYPPYSIRRLGWGTFTIFANIILKAGYSWVSPEAEDTSDGAEKGKLPLEWTLDFGGRGSQGRLRLKVKKEKDGQEQEDEEQVARTRRIWTRQRERDPDFVPADDIEVT